jgi:hypothetical protein
MHCKCQMRCQVHGTTGDHPPAPCSEVAALQDRFRDEGAWVPAAAMHQRALADTAAARAEAADAAAARLQAARDVAAAHADLEQLRREYESVLLTLQHSEARFCACSGFGYVLRWCDRGRLRTAYNSATQVM